MLHDIKLSHWGSKAKWNEEIISADTTGQNHQEKTSLHNEKNPITNH